MRFTIISGGGPPDPRMLLRGWRPSDPLSFLTLTLAFVCLAATAHAQADLRLEAVQAAAERVEAGAQVAVSAQVRNVGDVAAPATRLKYYFSADATYGAGDKYLNYDAVSALEPGEASPESANVRVPAGTADGAYFVLLVADQTELVAEPDELDNIVALPIEVGTVVAGADLRVERATLDVDAAEAGQVLVAGAAVVEAGAGSETSTLLKYYLSADEAFDAGDKYLNYDRVPALGAGDEGLEVANLRLPGELNGQALRGQFFILFVADARDDLAEADEDNNVVALPIAIGEAVGGLFLQETSVAAEVRPGETLQVDVVVGNNGLETLEGQVSYLISRDTVVDAEDRQLSYDRVEPLAPAAERAEEAALRVHGSTAGGDWFLLFVLGEQVVALPFVVVVDDPEADLADLVPLLSALSAPVVAPGATVVVSTEITNAGTQPAVASRLKYYLSVDAFFDPADDYLNYDAVAALLPGEVSPESATLRVPAETAAGALFILVVADETAEVAERFETNNVVALALNVGEPELPGDIDGPAADLVAELVSLSATGTPGERVELSLDVRNIGAVAAPASRVKYYFSRDTERGDDTYLGYDVVGALEPGEASAEGASPKIPAGALHGTWYVLLVADANDDVSEADEANVTAIAIQIEVDQPGADLADLRLDVLALEGAAAGDHLWADLAIRNEGTQPAVAVELRLWLEGEFLTVVTVPELGVGEEIALSLEPRIPPAAADGQAELRFFLDAAGEVEERFESDNERVETLAIGGKALTLDFACPGLAPDAWLLQRRTVASFNALHLGWDNKKDMDAFACVIAHFDLVGLVEIDDASAVEAVAARVSALTGETFDWHVSPYEVGNERGKEFYGYIWRRANAELLAPVGFYPDPGDIIKREPYGADFRVGNSEFTLVMWHLRYGNVLGDRRVEAAELGNIHSWFDAQSPRPVLIGGDFNLPGTDAGFSAVAEGTLDFAIDPAQPTSIAAEGLASPFDNFFFEAGGLPFVRSAGAFDFAGGDYANLRQLVSDHVPVWLEVE